MVCNCSKLLLMYIRNLDSFDISDISDSGALERNRHACQTLQKFWSAMGIILDWVAMVQWRVGPCFVIWCPHTLRDSVSLVCKIFFAGGGALHSVKYIFLYLLSNPYQFYLFNCCPSLPVEWTVSQSKSTTSGLWPKENSQIHVPHASSLLLAVYCENTSPHYFGYSGVQSCFWCVTQPQ